MRTHLLRSIVPLSLHVKDSKLCVPPFNSTTSPRSRMSQILHLTNFLPLHRSPFIPSKVHERTFFRPIRRPSLVPFTNKFDLFGSFFGVFELFELGAFDGVSDCDFPFVVPRSDEGLHFFFEVFADAEFVFEDDLAEVFHAAVHAFEPSCGTLETVACANIEHEISELDVDREGVTGRGWA